MRERQSAPPKTKDARESAAHASVGMVTPFQHGDCRSVRPAMCVHTHEGESKRSARRVWRRLQKKRKISYEYRSLLLLLQLGKLESWSDEKVEPMIQVELPIDRTSTIQYIILFIIRKRGMEEWEKRTAASSSDEMKKPIANLFFPPVYLSFLDTEKPLI